LLPLGGSNLVLVLDADAKTFVVRFIGRGMPI